MVRRIVVLMVVLAVATAGCGGGSVSLSPSDSAGTTTGAPAFSGSLDPDVLAFADAVTDRLGDDAGLVAVAYAMDRGYLVDQIVPAGLAGELRGDGTIPGVDPASAPVGFFSDLPEAGGSAAGMPVVWAAPAGLVLTDEGQMDSGQFLTTAKAQASEQLLAQLESGDSTEEFTPAAWAIYIIAMLLDNGYSSDQILFAFARVEGEIYAAPWEPPGNWCFWIQERDPPGPNPVAIAPEFEGFGQFPAQAECRERINKYLATPPEAEAEAEDVSEDGTETPAAPDEPAEAFPRIYRGDGVYRITRYDSDTDVTNLCENDVTIELRLEADGSAVFTYSPGWGTYIDGDHFECREAAGQAWIGTYDAAAGTFTILPPAEDPQREYWDVGGDFDESSAFGPAGYARLHPYPDNTGYQRGTYDFEFNLPLVP